MHACIAACAAADMRARKQKKKAVLRLPETSSISHCRKQAAADRCLTGAIETVSDVGYGCTFGIGLEQSVGLTTE
jgi:hypothetical protein